MAGTQQPDAVIIAPSEALAGTAIAASPAVPGAPAESDSGGPLAHIPLFSALAPSEQQALFASMRIEAIEPNQTIFWRGDQGDSFYLISRGQVSISVPSDQGEHVMLDYLGPGGFFGEISLLDGGPRTATVRAATTTELYVLRRDDFHAFMRARPDVAIEILTIMGQRQRISTEALRGMKNPNVAFEQTRITIWQRISDLIATVAASKWFTLAHVIWFGGWIGVNLLAMFGGLPARLAFDPFPFGLLTMTVSLEAIFLSIFVMVSQNRQAEKDRLRIDLDYQVNVKAQTEIVMLARKLDRMEAQLLGNVEKSKRQNGGTP